jgi:ubiquinone/menaquinone biosynthesis C-methylase UbiE
MKQHSEPQAREVSIQEQAQRFDEEAVEYDLRHTNSAALQYRDTFYRRRLFDFDMSGKKVLDAMCATGIDTPFLISQGAEVQGLDISSSCAEIYRQRFQLPCVAASIHDTGFPADSFDVIALSGGLHHVSSFLDETFAELYRIMKPGGWFCFVEPNADSWIDKARRYWYSRSDEFGSDERALSYRSEIAKHLTLGFVEEDYFTGGNLAYLLLQQSNVLKTPKFITNQLKKPLFLTERFIGALPFAPTCYFCARWRKS